MIIIMLVHIVTVMLLLPTTLTIIIITGGRGSSTVSAIMLAAQYGQFRLDPFSPFGASAGAARAEAYQETRSGSLPFAPPF
jgi:hypothetical protein